MNRYIDFVLRWPKLILFILAALTIILTPGIRQLEFDNSVEAFLPKDDHEYRYYNEIRDIYGDSGRFLIMAISNGNLLSSETFVELDNFFTDLEEYKDFDEKRERARIERLDSIIAGGKISYSDLMIKFRDDPSFGRLLGRKIETYRSAAGYLGGGDLKKLRKKILHSYRLKNLEMIDDIISPLTAQDITGINDTLEAYYLIEKTDDERRILPQTKGEIEAFKKKLERNPAFEGGIYSRDPESGEITDFGSL